MFKNDVLEVFLSWGTFDNLIINKLYIGLSVRDQKSIRSTILTRSFKLKIN